MEKENLFENQEPSIKEIFLTIRFLGEELIITVIMWMFMLESLIGCLMEKDA